MDSGIISGDVVEVCEDSLRDILPSCPHRRVFRRKRQATQARQQYDYNEWCRDSNFNIVQRCAHRTVTCNSGCPSDMISYDCTNPGQTCSYTIVCSGINNISPESTNEVNSTLFNTVIVSSSTDKKVPNHTFLQKLVRNLHFFKK